MGKSTNTSGLEKRIGDIESSLQVLEAHSQNIEISMITLKKELVGLNARLESLQLIEPASLAC